MLSLLCDPCLLTEIVNLIYREILVLASKGKVTTKTEH